jgi:hypothetical protein
MGKPDFVVLEAVRCLVNMIFKSNSLRLYFLQKQWHIAIGERLKAINIENPESQAILCPMLRLLFLAARPVEENLAHRDLAAMGTFIDIFNILKYAVNQLGFPSPNAIPLVRECLQNMFNITIDMGPLGKGNMKYEDITPNYEEVVTVLLGIFNTPMTTFDPVQYDIRLCCINCFINIPVKFFRILVVLGDKDSTLKTLCDALEYEVREVGDNSKNLTMILMVSQLLLSQSLESRPYYFQRLFPNRDLERESLDASEETNINMDVLHKDSDTLGNRIVKYMTSFNQALKYSASELLFALVGEDAELLVRLVGFGNAAGLLAMRNLFGMGKHLKEES